MRRAAPLAPVAVAAWAGAVVAVVLPAAAGVLAAVLWAAAVIALTIAMRRPGSAAALIAVALAAAAVVASHVAAAQPAREAAISFGVDGGRALELTAVVTSKVAPAASGSLWFDADAGLIEAGGRALPTAVPVSVSVAPTDITGGRLDLGSKVVISGTAVAGDAGDRAVLVVFASRGVRVTDPPLGLEGAASDLRTGFVTLTARLPGDGGGLLPGLAVGDTSAVSGELDAAMKASSLSHLTAVSGANCAIIVGLVFGGAALCGARRWLRVVASLTALAGFVVLVTPEPSVVRAAAMATAAMLGVLLGRPAAGAGALGLAVIVLIAADPWLALSLGFALSAAATAALLVLAPPLARGLARHLPSALALVLAVPLAAQLACGPLLVLVNPVVPLYGVLANLVAGPAAPAATVLGLVACLLAPVLPGLAGLVAGLAWLPSSWIAATATTAANLPAASIPWLEGWGGAAALAGLGLCVVVVVAWRSGGLHVLIPRVVATVVLSGTVGALLGNGALAGPVGVLSVPSGWSIAACDVGQGDAVLVRSGAHVALIDTGPAPEPLRACLARLGIGHIELLVLTHFDLDHAGGADALVGSVGTVLHGPVGDAGDTTLLDRFAHAGARVAAVSAGMTGSLGDARWRVLWPRANGVAFPPGNDASVIVEMRGGRVPASLFLGDLSATPQAILAGDRLLQPPYEVVKVAHHGSADQDAGLYRRIHAAVAVVSVGSDNDYGHPRAETLQLLSAAGTAIGRTDRDGLVLVADSGEGVDLWRERGPPTGAGSGVGTVP
ncbi:MAG TPA: ComEC/Rec2 family competence protein [Microbacterium sp.]|nr:ComEC/Rec2 family competence protein [Microbacterium sp.]